MHQFGEEEGIKQNMENIVFLITKRALIMSDQFSALSYLWQAAQTQRTWELEQYATIFLAIPTPCLAQGRRVIIPAGSACVVWSTHVHR